MRTQEEHEHNTEITTTSERRMAKGWARAIFSHHASTPRQTQAIPDKLKLNE